MKIKRVQKKWVEKNETTNYNGKTTVFVLPSVTPMKEQEDYMCFMKQNRNKVFHRKYNNIEKCAGIGLNGFFHTLKNKCRLKNLGSRLGFAC